MTTAIYDGYSSYANKALKVHSTKLKQSPGLVQGQLGQVLRLQ